MRTLLYVPIIHSEVELGSLAPSVRRRFVEAFGDGAWQRRGVLVEAMWQGIHDTLMGLRLPPTTTRLYQDGLPICGYEREIVEELATKGSRNHQLLQALVARGAVLMGTEDPALMLAEYRRIQRLAWQSSQPDAEVAAELEQEGKRLLLERDMFIARRIDETLDDGELAILLIGMQHRVDELLEDKLTIQHVIHSLPFGADGRFPRGRDHAH